MKLLFAAVMVAIGLSGPAQSASYSRIYEQNANEDFFGDLTAPFTHTFTSSPYRLVVGGFVGQDDIDVFVLNVPDISLLYMTRTAKNNWLRQDLSTTNQLVFVVSPGQNGSDPYPWGTSFGYIAPLSSIPLPAGVLLLPGGLGALMVTRRSKITRPRSNPASAKPIS